MAWTWLMNQSSDDNFGAPPRGFASQADAETWLGQVWRDLAEQGVGTASLYEDDRLVYGPMSLEPS